MSQFVPSGSTSGEVLINETREYGAWADWLGIPRRTFSAMFGVVIARGEDYRQVFQYLDLERQARLDAVSASTSTAADATGYPRRSPSCG